MDHLGDHRRPRGIRVDAVGKHCLLVAQRRIQIDYLATTLLGHLVKPGHDLLLHDLVGNPPAPGISGHRIANKHLGLALQFTETLDQVEVIGHVIGLVLPVLRFRIVGSQFDDHHLGFKRVGLLEGSLFPVGLVSLFQEGRSVDPEISDVPPLAQHPAQLSGIAVLGPVLDRGPESYAVTNASHALGTLDRLGMDKPRTTEKEEDKEDERKLFLFMTRRWLGVRRGESKPNRALSKNKHGYSTFNLMLCEWLLNSGAYMHCTLVMPV